MEKRIKYGKRFAREAGAVLMEWFRRELIIEKKGITDLVTQADKKSEAYLLGSIFQYYPEDAILTEESGAIERPNAPCRWILDPLDGTTNFAQGFPLFSISIALEQDGIINGAIIYLPFFDECFEAIRGKGALLNGKPITVSDKTELIDSVLATGFPYSKHIDSDNNVVEFSKLIVQSRGIRRGGSAAIDLAYTARGIWDGYWEKKLKPWDLAAGSLLVTEAGGVITRPDGKPFELLGGDIVAGNQEIVDKIVAITQG